MLLDLLLVAATLACGLVTGLLLGFAIVAMPGIAALDDRGFVRAFQVMDGVIQRRQPLFLLLWVGSVVAVLAAAATGLGELDGGARAVLLASTVLWLVGVQATTAVANVPRNNALQDVDLDRLDDADVRAARQRFEGPWNRWNALRTACGTATTLGLLLVLLAR